MTESLEARIQRLEDRALIVETIVRYANSLDSCDYEEMRGLLTDEVQMDFAYMGIPSTRFDADDWVAFARQALSVLKCTHHISPNHVIHSIDGDTAHCTSYMYAQHWMPNDRGGDEFLMRGYYANELRRVDGGWRIAAMRQITTWTSGNSQMFEIGMGDPGSSATPRRR